MSDTTTTCVCCGHLGSTARVTGGPIHFECWNEHHSDSFEEWPPGHVCADARNEQ